MQIIAACPLVEGQEVFNTFGELDNSELVCKYGFALHDNPFSNLQLDKDLMVAKASKLLGSRECKRRCSYLEKQRWLQSFTRLLWGETKSILNRGTLILCQFYLDRWSRPHGMQIMTLAPDSLLQFSNQMFFFSFLSHLLPLTAPSFSTSTLADYISIPRLISHVWCGVQRSAGGGG
jgi:hypothetical protein